MGRPSNFRKSSPPSSRSAKPSQKPQGREMDIPKSWRVIAGTHAIDEALRVRPHSARLLWLRQGWESAQDLQQTHDSVLKTKAKIEIKAPAVLERICATNQGAVLFVEGQPEFMLEKEAEKARSSLVFLDGLEDPHNLGAIVRTSWLLGVGGVFIPEERSVGLTSTAHKVACGGAEHVPVEPLSNFANHAKVLKEQGYWIFGLSHKSTRSLYDLQIPEKVVWAIGNEEKGLRITTERACDELISIPQISAAASYNASVATAIALAETHRQHTMHHTNRKKS